jgi:hypothetical protein
VDWIVIDGVRPYDGRFEFDIAGQEFTTREWGWIKRLSGYLPLTIEQGFSDGDAELFCAFAVVAMHRAGTIDRRDVPDVFERLADAPFGSTVTLESDGAGADDDDPFAESTRESSPPNTPISGLPSMTHSESWGETQPATGNPGSGTSASLPKASGI